VRPSSGAATFASGAVLELSRVLGVSNLAAPEDGCTPAIRRSKALAGSSSLSIYWTVTCPRIRSGTGSCDITTNPEDHAACEPASLYDKLEKVVVPLFYGNRDRFLDIMRHAIALNGSFFNTQRIVLQYVLNACFE
jgi:hypothetical protein